jgi:4a-hydroxytetrahydrobiopterin dehydratase
MHFNIIEKEANMTNLLTKKEIEKNLSKIPGWKRSGREISRLYTFSGFIAAIAFVNHVADLAEAMDHHPDILIQYKKVKLTLSTHSAGGLTDLDFRLAQKIDA